MGIDALPTSVFQRIGVRLLQAVQLQNVIKRPILQQHALAYLEVGQQESPWFLGHLGCHIVVDNVQLLDVYVL